MYYTYVKILMFCGFWFLSQNIKQTWFLFFSIILLEKIYGPL